MSDHYPPIPDDSDTEWLDVGEFAQQLMSAQDSLEEMDIEGAFEASLAINIVHAALLEGTEAERVQRILSGIGCLLSFMRTTSDKAVPDWLGRRVSAVDDALGVVEVAYH